MAQVKAIPFPPPRPDLAAEALLVGYCLDPVSGEAARMAAESLDDGAVQGELAPVWRAARRALLEGRDPDIPTVAAEAGPPWTVGAVLGAAEAVAPTTDDAMRAVRSLVELARRRKLFAAMSEAAVAVGDKGAAAGLAVLEAASLDMRRLASEGPRLIGDLASEALERARKAREAQDTQNLEDAEGLPTGIAPLDHMTGGLEPGDLWVLAGRTSQGKTSLALQIALTQTVPVLFVSAEVTAERLGRKALASLADVPVPKMRRGAVDDADMARLERQAKALGLLRVLVDDRSRTVASIRATARTASGKLGQVGLVVVDYLQLLDPDYSGKDKHNRQEVVASISRSLKAMALEERVPILALAQLSRAAEEDKRPELRHLRESGAIEQDADVVVMIHRPKLPKPLPEKAPKPVNLNIAKQRDGATAYIECQWYPETQTVRAVGAQVYEGDDREGVDLG